MEKTKNSTYPRKSPINLKDIPPLDPSSIPYNYSLSNYQKPSARTLPFYAFQSEEEYAHMIDVNLMNRLKVEEEDGDSSLSTKHIDPNSTTSSISREEKDDPEKYLVSDSKSKIQDDWKRLTHMESCLEISDDSKRVVLAKSELHEVCAAKHWNPPVFECCNDEGPCHMRLFTYKVVIEIVESSNTTILECLGAPQSQKKAAAESAAEGALWYLRRSGHFPVTRERRRCKAN